MQIVISNHAARRLQDARQSGITVDDLLRVAGQVPGKVPIATRFRGFGARSGRQFDFVIKDVQGTRLIVTIIGR